MEHLSLDTLSRLVEEPASPEEAAHLASCESCRAELSALRAQTEALRHLPDLRPPLGDWEVLQARLVSEGLVKHPTGLAGVLAVTPGWMRAAASVLLFLGGTALGVVLANSGAAPFGPAAGLGSADTAEEAARLVRVAEQQYVEALFRHRQLLEQEGGMVDFADPASRYAALDYLVAAGQAAVRQAPADPFLNGLLASTLAERQAVLRRISSSEDNWF
jgi:hypothetical protein